jgi:hypothetical protein
MKEKGLIQKIKIQDSKSMLQQVGSGRLLLLLLLLVPSINAWTSSLIPANTQACETTHIVGVDELGNIEKIYDIAKHNNMTMEHMVEMNRQYQANQKLFIGEKLCIVNNWSIPTVSSFTFANKI